MAIRLRTISHVNRSSLAALLLLGLLLVCYWATLRETALLLVASEDMAHGFFAPIVALYVIWSHKGKIRSRIGEPSRWGIVVLLLGALLAVPASFGASTTVSRLGFVISLCGCLLSVGGVSLLKVLSFPTALLLYTFPIPAVAYGEITLPLQLLASRLAEGIFELLGYSVIREGNILELAKQRLNVVEACSGLRSLVTLSFFTTVYAYLLESKNWLRLLLLLISIPSAILINALRIATTGILGNIDPALTKGTAHDVTGWVCFVIGFLLLLPVHWLANRLYSSESRLPKQ